LLPSLSVSQRNVVVVDDEESETSTVVQWLSGACMLAQRDALAAARGFDPRYFMYWEDADLCRRLRTRGYHIRYVPRATAVHRVGHSSRTVRSASIRWFHESAYVYYATHVAPGLYNPKRWVARVLLAVRCWWQLRQRAIDEPGHILRDRQA
jgi:GT2 family glycosyltransferase